MGDEAKPKTRFNQDQWERLKRCSDKKDVSEWNDWRSENLNEVVALNGVDLKHTNLNGVDFTGAFLEDAKFEGASMDRAVFSNANLKGASLINTQLKKAKFHKANLFKTKFHGANLQGASFFYAWLDSAGFFGAGLQTADFNEGNLSGASFYGSYLNGSKFNFAQLDGKTRLFRCSFDKETDFTGVGLDGATIDPGMKVALKNNIRRIHWQKWIEKQRTEGKRLVPRLVEWFWWVTDYGGSTQRIIKTFFGSAFGFGVFYWLLAIIPGWNGIIDALWQGNGWIGVLQTFVRSIYFSIVTMTTLGFGDMHAAEYGFLASVLGNIFLSFQVLLGYVLLGALITRLGILFTGEAPAASGTKPVVNKS